MIDPQTYDWSRFEIAFYYDRSVSDVFRSWVTGSGLEAFFIERAFFKSGAGTTRAPNDIVEKGDQYRWEWRQPFSVEGEVIAVKDNEEFSFTFGSMKVSVHFSRVGDQTELVLVQSEIPDTEDGRVFGHLNCRSCWVFFLTNLKSVLETGRDLRDSSPERVSSIEVGFKPLSRND
jgi:uncharacterized protein YndB with AHSA1/START domain